MADELSKDIDGLYAGLSKLDKLLEKLTVSAGKFSGALSGTRGGSNGAGVGALNLGNSGTNMMPTSLGNVPQFLAMNRGMNVGFSMIQGAMQAATGVIAGGFSAMPDVAATTGRSSALYAAALSSGTRGWNGIGSGTLRLMKGGITTPGGEGAVAAQLSGMGFQYGGKGVFGGFDTLASSVAGAAIGFNMENGVAAQALGGLTSGATSSAIMQNFGVFTTNPMTGERATPTQTFAMLNDRLTQGGKMSRAELSRALNGGWMEQNIKDSGLDEAQQSLLKQYMLDAADGNYWNLSDKKAMAARAQAAGGNPLQPLMDVNSAQSGSMQAASDSYVAGMQKAAKAVELFEGAMTNFLNSPAGKFMAQLNGGVNLASQDQAVQGGLMAVGGVLGGAMNIGGSILGASMLGKMMGGGQTATTIGSAAKTAGVMGLKGLGLIGGTIGVGVNAASAYQNAQAGADGWSVAGNALAGAASGALAGAMFGAPGAIIGGVIGAGSSLIGSFLGAQDRPHGGSIDLVGTGGLTPTNGGLKLVAPVNGPITTKYGQTTDVHGNQLWGGNQHKAIDYGVPKGTPVQAAAAGTASSGVGAGDRSYGNYVTIDHGNGYSTLYAHLSQISITNGQKVQQGQVIGLSGDTGYVTGPHLHFETRQGGNKINPANLGLGPAVAVVAGSSDTSMSSAGVTSGVSGAVGGNANIIRDTNTTSTAAVPQSYRGASIGGGASASVSGGSGIASNTGFGSMQNGTGRGSGVGSGQGGPGLDTGTSKGGVIINLTIAQASAEEAKRFADIVKEQLESEKLMTSMGRM